MTLFGLATESCTYILLGPSLAWAMVQAWTERRMAANLTLGTCYFLLIAGQAVAWFSGGIWLRRFGPQPLAALIFFGYVITTFWRETRSQIGQEKLTARHADEVPMRAA